MTYSHMGKPHTTIGAAAVSLLSSGWGQVVPLLAMVARQTGYESEVSGRTIATGQGLLALRTQIGRSIKLSKAT